MADEGIVTYKECVEFRQQQQQAIQKTQDEIVCLGKEVAVLEEKHYNTDRKLEEIRSRNNQIFIGVVVTAIGMIISLIEKF